jgi:hypothetical protein
MMRSGKVQATLTETPLAHAMMMRTPCRFGVVSSAPVATGDLATILYHPRNDCSLSRVLTVYVDAASYERSCGTCEAALLE